MTSLGKHSLISNDGKEQEIGCSKVIKTKNNDAKNGGNENFAESSVSNNQTLDDDGKFSSYFFLIIIITCIPMFYFRRADTS